MPGKSDSTNKDAAVSHANVSGGIIHDADDLTVKGLQQAISAKVDKIRDGTDKEFSKNMNVFKNCRGGPVGGISIFGNSERSIWFSYDHECR